MRIQELTEYLDTYLRAGEFHDYAPNGLQVEGTREVKHIVLGVSASLGLIDEAARRWRRCGVGTPRLVLEG